MNAGGVGRRVAGKIRGDLPGSARVGCRFAGMMHDDLRSSAAARVPRCRTVLGGELQKKFASNLVNRSG